MAFIKYPAKAFFHSLSHAENSIYLKLLFHHFRFCSGDYSRNFYMTDRDLSSLTGCSLSTVWLAKKSLTKHNLINFEIGPKNRTYYSIIPNGSDPAK